MKHKDSRKTLLRSALTVAFAGLLAGVPAVASAQATANLEGTWKLAAPQVTLKPVDGGEIPFTKDGKTYYDQNRKSAAKKDIDFDQSASVCSSPGLPRIMLTANRFRILQRERVVTILFEWNRLFRQIDLRGGEQKEPEVGTMNGLSFGKWEGDTLVVNSFGFLPDKLIDNYVSGSEQLKLVERLRLKDQNTLEDRITITDPQNFTRPWETVLTYKRQPDQPFPEDNCLDRKVAGQKVLWPR